MNRRYVIHSASKPPPNRGPIEGGGTWVVNKPNGYYLGFASAGSSFELAFTSASGWHYGRVHGFIDLCGWIVPDAIKLSAPHQATPPSCSAASRNAHVHRLSLGKNFNLAPHVHGGAGDGTHVAVRHPCNFHRNYFRGSSLHGGHWSAGLTVSGKVFYRFTTRFPSTNPAAVVRAEGLGWGFIPLSHITALPPHLSNAND
jgi:hypothetical protein